MALLLLEVLLLEVLLLEVLLLEVLQNVVFSSNSDSMYVCTAALRWHSSGLGRI
jgi:hypothetical protein